MANQEGFWDIPIGGKISKDFARIRLGGLSLSFTVTQDQTGGVMDGWRTDRELFVCVVQVL